VEPRHLTQHAEVGELSARPTTQGNGAPPSQRTHRRQDLHLRYLRAPATFLAARIAWSGAVSDRFDSRDSWSGGDECSEDCWVGRDEQAHEGTTHQPPLNTA